jgi:catabolite regulation protein CreA
MTTEGGSRGALLDDALYQTYTFLTSHEKIHYYDIKTINISLVCDYSIQQLWCYISTANKKDVNQNVGFLEDSKAYNVPPTYLVIA